MNEMQIFSHPEFGKVRAFEIDGEPWLVGKDVAEALGYSNPHDALIRHVDDEDKNAVVNPDGNRGNPNRTVINESGLYSLVLFSEHPGALKFHAWMTGEVLPSIRKSSGHIHGQDDMTPEELIAAALVHAVQKMHSLSAQVRHYSKLIQANPEWIYVGVYADEGVTGTSTAHRDEFNRLMADCDAGRVDIILVKSISRFARDTVGCLNAIRHLRDIGVEVRFERERISTASMDGELLLTLLASFAQAESESISANVKWSTRKRFEEGIPNGHKAPYGYEWDGEMFRIIPEQGEVVKRIYERYLAGESAYSIAKALKEQGVVGQNGGPMCDSTIKDIVTNIAYTGTMILQKHFFTEGHARRRNKGELPRYAVEEMYEPLVSVEDFDRALAIHERRAGETPAPTITKFSGLVKCGNCGKGISRRTTKRAKIWGCNTRERKGRDICDMRPLREEELEAAAEKVVGAASDEEFRRLVKRITVFGDRIEFRLENNKTQCVTRVYGGYKVRNGFSGKLICAECGSKLSRDTWGKKEVKTISWGCTGPRSACSLRRLREDELRMAAESILATKDYEPAFVERVQRALVSSDSIQFEFKNGTVRTWQRG